MYDENISNRKCKSGMNVYSKSNNSNNNNSNNIFKKYNNKAHMQHYKIKI